MIGITRGQCLCLVFKPGVQCVWEGGGGKEGTHGRVRVVQEIFHGVVGLRERLLEDTRHRRDGAMVMPSVGVDLP